MESRIVVLATLVSAGVLARGPSYGWLLLGKLENTVSCCNKVPLWIKV